MNDANTPLEATDAKPPTVEREPATTPAVQASGNGPTEDARPTIDVSKLPKIRRTSYVIDRRRQYRTALLTSSMAALLLLIVNTAFTLMRNSQMEVISSVAPRLQSTLVQQDARIGTMLILASVIFVVGIFVITIAETHRTAGAVYAVERALERVADGDFRTPLRLRPHDNLRDLRAPFNDMVSTLRKHAAADAEALDRLADAANENPALADELRALAAKKRELGGVKATV